MDQHGTKSTSIETTYEDATLKIDGRTVASEDYVMQISSISQASIGKIPGRSLSILLLAVCAVLAILFLGNSSFSYMTSGVSTLVGWGAIGVAVYHVYKVVKQAQQYGLMLELNSGQKKYFLSDDKAFLRKVLSIIEIRMQQPGVHQDTHVLEFAKGAIDNRTQNIIHTGSGSVITDSDIHNTKEGI